MRLTVFGATGRIGSEVVQQALAAGHKVTAVVRSSFDINDRSLTVVTVPGLTDPELLLPALEGADAAISGVGPRSRKDVKVASVATRGILAALRASGVRRFAAVSAWPVGPLPEGESLAGRFIFYPMISAILKETYADLAVMEKEIMASGLEWTIVRPPRLNDGPLTASYRTAIGANVRNARIISRADVAHSMLAAITNPAAIRQPLGVSR